MIRAVFSGLAGAFIARSVERGDIPERFAVPLTFLATRIPTPLIFAGAIGYGIYRWDRETRARGAREVTSPRAERQSSRKQSSANRRRQRRSASDRTTDAAREL